ARPGDRPCSDLSLHRRRHLYRREDGIWLIGLVLCLSANSPHVEWCRSLLRSQWFSDRRNTPRLANLASLLHDVLRAADTPDLPDLLPDDCVRVDRSIDVAAIAALPRRNAAVDVSAVRAESDGRLHANGRRDRSVVVAGGRGAVLPVVPVPGPFLLATDHRVCLGGLYRRRSVTSLGDGGQRPW